MKLTMNKQYIVNDINNVFTVLFNSFSIINTLTMH